jgi:NAD(P)-dependent dehydrogenase (short-subunit alcohol dehydrogenase family)
MGARGSKAATAPPFNKYTEASHVATHYAARAQGKTFLITVRPPRARVPACAIAPQRRALHRAARSPGRACAWRGVHYEPVARCHSCAMLRVRAHAPQGAAAGLGFETARVLASVGGRVYLAARSQAAADGAVARLRTSLGPAGADADAHALALDLSSLASVAAGAADFMRDSRTLDVLICNAGVMAPPLSVTADGFETQHGVNHVGHQHLTQLLLPTLAASGTAAEPARVVSVSSMGNWVFALPEGIRFEALPPDAATYSPWTRYSETKLANILMARELTRRAAAAGQHVIGVALHPGVIMGTTLARHFDFGSTCRMLRDALRRGTTTYALTQQSKSTAQGAATQVLCALDPGVTPGGYYADCAPQSRALHPMAGDAKLQARLWEHTEELVRAAQAKK